MAACHEKNGCLLLLVFKISLLIFNSPEPKAPGYRQAPFSAGSRSVVGYASDSEPDVPGSIPGPATYIHFSFR